MKAYVGDGARNSPSYSLKTPIPDWSISPNGAPSKTKIKVWSFLFISCETQSKCCHWWRRPLGHTMLQPNYSRKIEASILKRNLDLQPPTLELCIYDTSLILISAEKTIEVALAALSPAIIDLWRSTYEAKNQKLSVHAFSSMVRRLPTEPMRFERYQHVL